MKNRPTDDSQVKVRLPKDLHEWIKQEAHNNRSTQASEIVRAVRERKQRAERSASA